MKFNQVLVLVLALIFSSCKSGSGGGSGGGGGTGSGGSSGSVSMSASTGSSKLSLEAATSTVTSSSPVTLTASDFKVANSVEKTLSDADATFEYLKSVISASKITSEKIYPIFLLGTIEANKSDLLSFSAQLLEAPLSDKPSESDEYKYFIYTNRLFLNSSSDSSEIISKLDKLLKNQLISSATKSALLTEYLLYKPELTAQINSVANTVLAMQISN